MSGLVPTAREHALKYLFTDDSTTRPTEWHVSLHKGTFDPDDPGGSEVTTSDFDSYARQSVTFVASGDDAETDSSVSWSIDSNATEFSVTAVAVWDASTDGNCLGYAPVVVSADPGSTVAFAAGSVKMQLLDQC